MEQQRLIILRGAPASGKTTIAKSFRNFNGKVTWLKVDSFKDFFAEDSSIALNYVNGAAAATLEYLLKKGFSVVIDGIFQDTSAIDEMLKIAKENNIAARVFELVIPLETLQTRDKTREGVKEGIRKPLGDETISKVHAVLTENSYPGAIKLDTENNSIEECKKIIESYF